MNSININEQYRQLEEYKLRIMLWYLLYGETYEDFTADMRGEE